MKTPNEIIKEECEKMYPEFLQRDCNDLVVILAGRLQTALHQQLQKARQDWLREEIVRLEGMDEYIAVKDNDSHRYQILRSKKDEWDAFCEIPEYDERSWDVPEWAERIDGMPVKSFKQTIIDRYQSELDQDKE